MPFRILVVGVVSGLLCLYLVHMRDHAARFGGSCVRTGCPPVESYCPSCGGVAVGSGVAAGTDRSVLARCGMTPTQEFGSSAAENRVTVTEETLVVDVKRETIERLLTEDYPLGHFRLQPSRDRHDREALAITTVTPRGAAELIGLRQGDILLAVNEQRVPTSVPELLALQAQLSDTIARSVTTQPDVDTTSLSSDRLPEFVDVAIERDGVPIRILVLMHQ